MKYFLISLALVGTMNTAFADALARVKAINLGGTSVYVLANTIAETLYVFDLDKTPGASACYADCAEKWPPYLVSAKEAQGLSGDYGVIKRTNNLLQLTFKNRPVYTFFLDRTANDALGSELGNVWHVIKAAY